jgi:hypothetical protein
MRGAILPLPNIPSWRGAQLKHRGNFTLHFTYKCNYLFIVKLKIWKAKGKC